MGVKEEAFRLIAVAENDRLIEKGVREGTG